MKIEAYTDGSAKNNGQTNAVGGWAYVVVIDDVVTHTYSDYKCDNFTNQQAELLAAILACDHLSNKFSILNTFTIYSDSAYLINCANDKWYKNWLKNNWTNAKGKPIANKEYWEFLIPYFENEQFTFKKVKGHSNVKYNNLADKLAQEAAEKGRKKIESRNNKWPGRYW